ncbi:MAG: PQQ-binding-like beta-propeller repeat protein, partial [Candidatus Acidiferrum sp.]
MRGIRYLSLALLPVAFILGTIASSAASDWPRFRGPNGAGVANDQAIPSQWTDRDILWQIAISGPGHSSPIISNGRLFLQAATASGTERQLVCIDAGTGRPIWSRT